MTSAEWLALKAERNASGRCLDCGRPERATQALCSHCAASMMRSQTRRRKRAVAAGLCIDCPDSKPTAAAGGTLRCERHRLVVRDAARNYNKRLKGVSA